jgi:hypothetical protein
MRQFSWRQFSVLLARLSREKREDFLIEKTGYARVCPKVGLDCTMKDGKNEEDKREKRLSSS